MHKRDKDLFLEFDNEYRKKIRKYFDSLDEKNVGSIGIEELEEPLITLEIARGHADVKRLMDEIDEDQSGEIEFVEFLEIMKGKRTIYGDQKIASSNSAIMNFFKEMVNQNADNNGKNQSQAGSFKLQLGQMRRGKLLNIIDPDVNRCAKCPKPPKCLSCLYDLGCKGCPKALKCQECLNPLLVGRFAKILEQVKREVNLN